MVVATDPNQSGVVAVAPTQVITVWNKRVTNVSETVIGPDQAQWSTGSAQGSGISRGPDRYFVRVNWPTLVMPRRKKSAHPVKYRM